MKKLLLTALFTILSALGWTIQSEAQITASIARDELKSAEKVEGVLRRIHEGPNPPRLLDRSPALATFANETQTVLGMLENVRLFASSIVALAMASIAAVWIPRPRKELENTSRAFLPPAVTN